MGIHMVEEGDIIEITDASLTKNGISLLGRRYEVKSFKGRAKLPEITATPLGMAHENYNPQANGTTWGSSGLSRFGRPNKIPPKSYTVFRAGEEKEGAAPSDEAKDEEPEAAPAPSASKPKSVAELVAIAAKPFLGNHQDLTNNLVEPFINDRELDYKAIGPQIQAFEANAQGFRARVIFSAPINYTEPETVYDDEKAFWKAVSTSAKAKTETIFREYKIGSKVMDITGRNPEGFSKFNCFKDGEAWNVPTTCIGLTIVLEDEDCLPTLRAHLRSDDDGLEFQLVHRFQPDITFTFPDAEPETEAEPDNPFAFGLPTIMDDSESGAGTGGGPRGVDWQSIIHIPCFDDNNKFASIQQNASSAQYDIRAVMGITFDHDDPFLKDKEMPYKVDWDDCPSILKGTESNGFVEAQFEVHKAPEGQPTDRLPGAQQEWLRSRAENPEGVDPKGWKYYPRLVRVILPGGDSSFMDIPIAKKDTTTAESVPLEDALKDPENLMLSDVGEVRYFEHKGKLREMRLTQTKTITKFGEGEMEESLHALWKVGNDYEFRTKSVYESNQWQKFRGRLLKILVNKEASRENAHKSAVEERRNRRLEATKTTNQSDIFFTKDPQYPNSFVIALKNLEGEPFTGQIIRINLGGSE